MFCFAYFQSKSCDSTWYSFSHQFVYLGTKSVTSTRVLFYPICAPIVDCIFETPFGSTMLLSLGNLGAVTILVVDEVP